MKVKNYAIIGIAFIVLFVGVVLLGHFVGFWHLPGQVAESENNVASDVKTENEKPEAAAPVELHGYANLKDWLAQNGIDAECVAAKLNLKVEDLNVEAKEIAHGKGMEPSDIQKIAIECKGNAQTTPPSDEKVAATTTASDQTGQAPTELKDFVNKEKIATDLTEDQKEKAEAISKSFKGGIVITPPSDGQYPTVGFLQGTDNLRKYCIDNNINMECLSQKIGVPVAQFDKPAKEIAAKLPGGHVEEIRKNLIGCVDYSR